MLCVDRGGGNLAGLKFVLTVIHLIFTKGFDRGSVVDAFSWSAKVVGRFLCFVGGEGSLGLQGRRMSCPHPGRITRVRFGHPLRASLRRAKGRGSDCRSIAASLGCERIG